MRIFKKFGYFNSSVGVLQQTNVTRVNCNRANIDDKASTFNFKMRVYVCDK